VLLEHSVCVYTKIREIVLKMVFNKVTQRNTSPSNSAILLRVMFLASMKKLPYLIVLDLA